MKIEIVPYLEINGCRTFPDDVVIKIFEKMVSDRTTKVVFYNGKTRTVQDFIRLLKSPENNVVFGLVDGEVSGVAWLNEVNDNYGTAHFCIFKEAWGKCSTELGRAALNYWFSFKRDTGDPVLDVILGVTPSRYKNVLRFIESLGFKQIGEVPKVLYVEETGERMSAIFSYCERF